jgi:Ser/Thr protein kinase RdoA (MazF antagonist)
VDDLSIIERVGKAFGVFHDCLEGFDTETLYISIPDFHNTPKRYKAFYDAIEKDVASRVGDVLDEIEQIKGFESKACLLQGYLDQGKIPLRVTHNDTKCNNVAFDKDSGEALAVLDLDTVMPGAVAYDFGDAIRFIANTVIEDDPDVEKVAVDLNKYEAFTKGFIGELKDDLTDFEKQTINLGVFTMTVELAVRFLTDYIMGDVYFKTKYPGHNLDRARNQIALAKDILQKYDQLQEILSKYI